MLILQRNPGQSICVDGPAVITVTRVRGDRVTIDVSAPASTKVLRGELLDPEQPAAAGEPKQERAA